MMKLWPVFIMRKLLFSIYVAMLNNLTLAQTYNYQYAHDALGNRTQKALVTRTDKSKEDLVSESDIICNTIKEEGFKREDESVDTISYGPLIKSKEEKQAYLTDMLSRSQRIKPIMTGGGKFSGFIGL